MTSTRNQRETVLDEELSEHLGHERNRAESRPAKGRNLAPSDACMRRLMRLPWPGSVRRLDRVPAEVSRRHRSGTIEVTD
jgi:transcriptional regulator of acetoin/glycerol metabolism